MESRLKKGLGRGLSSLLGDSSKEIVVEHYSNTIDELGRAIDPETGKPIACRAERIRTPIKIYRGHSAKELGIKMEVYPAN